ncbi:MAG: cobyric acid synthase [Candidatus Hydrothermarchaeales archaeon]
MTAKSLMVQGTTSYAGKTFLVMALCRIFADRSMKVAPFKSQNTSLNSFVTKDGDEIARAQALQAFAAGVEPTSDMNPILIKPKGDSRSQIIVNGRPYRDIDAWQYYEEFAMKEGTVAIEEAYRRLRERFDLIIIEGAGSPAEINLYDKDIVNMRVADMADSPVILIADIDRGGVFATIYGTISLLEDEHKERVKGIVINKFRGDERILKPGIEMIEELTEKSVLGTIPYIEDLELPDEDSISLESAPRVAGRVEIAVIRLPRISNFTDFDPLLLDGVNLRYVDRAQALKNPNAIIIPGTKNTIEDLHWLKERGFEERIKSMYGKVPIIGICGGYQMLGNRIIDDGIEGCSEEVEGLGLLDVETKFSSYKKTTKQARGRILADHGILEGRKGLEIGGYEIHMGDTTLGEGAQPVFEVNGKGEGAIDQSGLVLGTYLHGIFDASAFRRSLIGYLGKRRGEGDARDEALDIQEVWMENIRRASRIVSQCIDIDRLVEMVEGGD